MNSGLVLLSAFLISFGGHFLFRRLAPRLALPRPPAQALLSLPLGAALAFPLWFYSAEIPQAGALLWVLAAAFCAGALADFLRLPRWLQFLLGLAIAFWATQKGFLIEELKPPFFAYFIKLGPWAAPATMVWILAVAYAIILCRRLPGLTSGLVGIVSLAFFAVAGIIFDTPTLLTAPLACAIAGAALGAFPHELFFGFKPAAGNLKAEESESPEPWAPLSQGAAGHWILGFGLGLLTVIGFLKNTAFLLLAAPLLLLGIPVVEATYAFVYGSPEKRLSFSLGKKRELLHEALLRGGLSPRRCVAVFLAITLYFSAVAVILALMVRITFLVKIIVLGAFAAAGFVIFFCAARILSRFQRPAGEFLDKTDFLDVPVTTLDMEGALAKIDAYVQARTPHMVVTSDSSAIVRAHKDEELAAIMRAADMVTADGAGVVWMAKVLRLPLEQRVSGIDLIEQICARAAARGWSLYLLGAAPGIANDAAKRLNLRYPGLQIVGCMDGYFSPEQEPEVVADIAERRPDVLLVGLGIPKQEKWISHHLKELGVPVAIGVGGSFDVISGRLKRAPRWMQAAGLEWLYRTLQQPKRLPRLFALPSLFSMTLKAAFKRRKA
jgi:N-acetylglucosaminyldiphosphoundecaprenol N-acetyl-beta-D-mannosaminyltransferase